MVLSSLSLVGTRLLASLAMREVLQLIVLRGFVVGFDTGLTAMLLGAPSPRAGSSPAVDW